jgi:hypothetical protein
MTLKIHYFLKNLKFHLIPTIHYFLKNLIYLTILMFH